MTERELREIREKIACPQFGDKNYGAWGILTLEQRKTILKMLDYIARVKEETIYEFAGRAVLLLAENYSNEYCHWIDDTIDNLAKEMIRRAKYEAEKKKQN